MLETLPFTSIIQQRQFTHRISLYFQKWDVMITSHSTELFKDLWFNLVTSQMEMELAAMQRLGKVTATGKRQRTRVIAHLRLGQFQMKSTISRIFRMSYPWPKPIIQTLVTDNF